MKKYAFAFLAAILGGIFRAFVLMNLWNWFVTEVFNVSQISFLQVLGISLVISLFSSNSEKFTEEERRWAVLMTTLQRCVPEEQREALKEELKDLGDDIGALWGTIGGEVVGSTIVLCFGFLIHLLT